MTLYISAGVICTQSIKHRDAIDNQTGETAENYWEKLASDPKVKMIG